MSTPRYRFGEFLLDPANRRLLRAGAPVGLNARYFDALALLVREQGQLIGKQRFFDEVWAGSVVTDAALTQCIKEIRRQLGDDASNPHFVRTVAGHGYCFIAATQLDDGVANPASSAKVATPDLATYVMGPGPPPALARCARDAAAATLGGAMAGLLGGLLYGSALAFSPQSQGLGGLSVVLVLLALCVLIGMLGALGVGLGIGLGRLAGRGAGWTLAGGALGGLIVGGLARLLGSDAFALLVGHAPSGITGGLEGAAIGFAVATGLLLSGGPEAPRARPAIGASAAATGLVGAMIPLAGGNMMASSLASVAAAFDDSRLDVNALGRLFGEAQLGMPAQAALGGVEGALFGACVAGALVLAQRRITSHL